MRFFGMPRSIRGLVRRRGTLLERELATLLYERAWVDNDAEAPSGTFEATYADLAADLASMDRRRRQRIAPTVKQVRTAVDNLVDILGNDLLTVVKSGNGLKIRLLLVVSRTPATRAQTKQSEGV